VDTAKDTAKPPREQREERECAHCFSGWIYESTEDPLVDEALVCHMCGGTGRRSVYLYPKKRAERRA